MPLFGSSAKTENKSTTNNEDERQIAEGGGIALNSGGGELTLQMIPDEAFELAEMALASTQSAFATSQDTLAQALFTTQDKSKTESAQLGEQLIKIGIPVLALIFIVGKLN